MWTSGSKSGMGFLSAVNWLHRSGVGISTLSVCNLISFVGLAAAVRSHLEMYIVTSLELMTDVQPKFIRTLKVPDYFANFRESGDSLACYLGCSIVAKVKHPLYIFTFIRILTSTFSRCSQILQVGHLSQKQITVKLDREQ